MTAFKQKKALTTTYKSTEAILMSNVYGKSSQDLERPSKEYRSKTTQDQYQRIS